MKLKNIQGLKYGIDEAFYNLYLYINDKVYDQTAIDWINSDNGESLISSVTTDIINSKPIHKAAHYQHEQYIQIVYYEFLQQGILKFKKLSADWLKVKNISLEEAHKDRNFSKLNNGYIYILSQLGVVFQHQLNPMGEILPDYLTLTLNEFPIVSSDLPAPPQLKANPTPAKPPPQPRGKKPVKEFWEYINFQMIDNNNDENKKAAAELLKKDFSDKSAVMVSYMIRSLINRKTIFIMRGEKKLLSESVITFFNLNFTPESILKQLRIKELEGKKISEFKRIEGKVNNKLNSVDFI